MIVGAGGVKECTPEFGVVHGVGRVQIGGDRVQAGEVADIGQQAAERDADEQQRQVVTTKGAVVDTGAPLVVLA